MDTINTEKIYEFEVAFKQLYALKDISYIANKHGTLVDFLFELQDYLNELLPQYKIQFLYTNSDKILQNISVDKCNVKIDLLKENFLADISEFKLENDFYTFEGKITPPRAVLLNEKYSLPFAHVNLLKTFFYCDELIAVAFVIKEETDKKVSDDDYDLLNKILIYIDPILTNFAKKEKEANELAELHKNLNKISILYSISQAVNFIDDLKRLLKVVLKKALDTIQAEKASLMLYDFSDNSLQIKFVCGLQDKNLEADINNGVIECTKIKVNEGIAGTVFAQKRSIICNLGKNDPRFVASDITSYADTLLCVPLIAKGEAIGVFNISNKKDGRLFNHSDLEFMEALANQAAIAIDNSKLYELATKDGLTKLYIYRHFCTLFENEIRRASRYEHSVTFIMLDIDNFKKVNDTYGHLIGDQVLKEVAKTIANSVRKIDIAARYGGEEFAVILPETEAEMAKTIANRIRANVAKIDIEVAKNIHIRPSVSVGIAEYPTCADDGTTLIELADIALYQAKSGGKNIVYEYTPFGCQRVDENYGFEEVYQD